MKVWINGSFIDDASASVSVFDAGFQHGVGLFETMHARNGRVFRPRQHMQRLADSASQLRLAEQLQPDPLIEALQSCLQENSLKDARIRLTLTGGDLNLLQQTGNSASMTPTIVVQAQPPTEYPPSLYSDGVFASLASGRFNPHDLMAGHKTVNYWARLLNLQLASMYRCGEAIWLTPSAHLASGCVSNIFIVRDGTLFTPIARGEEEPSSEPSAVLPGITREAIIEVADAAGIGASRSTLTLDDLLEGEEAFMVNSSWGVMPLVGIAAATAEGEQRQPLGDGEVGEITRMLRSSYEDLVDSETG